MTKPPKEPHLAPSNSSVCKFRTKLRRTRKSEKNPIRAPTKVPNAKLATGSATTSEVGTDRTVPKGRKSATAGITGGLRLSQIPRSAKLHLKPKSPSKRSTAVDVQRLWRTRLKHGKQFIENFPQKKGCQINAMGTHSSWWVERFFCASVLDFFLTSRFKVLDARRCVCVCVYDAPNKCKSDFFKSYRVWTGKKHRRNQVPIEQHQRLGSKKGSSGSSDSILLIISAIFPAVHVFLFRSGLASAKCLQGLNEEAILFMKSFCLLLVWIFGLGFWDGGEIARWLDRWV